MYTHKMIDGETVALTPEEIAELTARDATAASVLEPAAPTKEELLAQLNAIAAQIQSLE